MSSLLRLYPEGETETQPKIQIIKEIPKALNPKAIERAVLGFVKDSHPKGSPTGLYKQTIESIAGCTFMGNQGDFWLAHIDNEVAAYALANILKSEDELSYCVSQVYAAKRFRGNPIVLEWWDVIKKHAEKHFCKKMMIVSSRNPAAYERWLGRRIKVHAVIMMERLGGE